MTSIVTTLFETDSASEHLVEVSAVSPSTGQEIDGSQINMSSVSAVNVPGAIVRDIVTAQAVPSGTMYTGPSKLKAVLPHTIGPMEDMYLTWTITNNAAVGAETAAVWTVTGYTSVAGTAVNVAAGSVVYGFPRYNLWTKPLLATTTPANVALALQNLLQIKVGSYGTVTGGGAALSAGALTLTLDVHVRDLEIAVLSEGTLVSAAPDIIAIVDCARSTPFVMGGGLLLAPSQLQIDYVNLLINNDVKAKITGGKLWLNTLLEHTKGKLANIGARCGYDFELNEPTYYVAAASASATTMVLPLKTFLGSNVNVDGTGQTIAEMAYPAKFPNSTFEIEVQFKSQTTILCSNTLAGSASVSTGNIGNLVLGQMTLRCNHFQQLPATLATIRNESKYKPIVVRYIHQQTGGLQGTAGLIVTGNEYSAKINDRFDAIAVQLALEPNNSAVADFYINGPVISQIRLVDGNNNSILGETSVIDSQIRDQFMPYGYPNMDSRIQDLFNIYSITFCRDIVAAKAKGAINGWYSFSGVETFYYQGPTVATTTFLPILHSDQIRGLIFMPDGTCKNF